MILGEVILFVTEFIVSADSEEYSIKQSLSTAVCKVFILHIQKDEHKKYNHF